MEEFVMTWIDISHPLTEKVATWSGDTPFSYEVVWPKEESGSVNVGKISMSIHTGTHIDAPFHFDSEGKRVGALDVSVYIGTSKVIDVSEVSCVTQELLADYLPLPPRLLLKTKQQTDPNRFPDHVTELDPRIGPWLKEQGVVLLGIDTASVDHLESKEMLVHYALFDNGVHILENAWLDHVAPGDYELIALPLNIIDADGSPVRAVIRPL
ncbi:arylformamidase [Priestia koreensis]